MTLTCQKHRFQLPTDAHYLNCAYMAPLARSVEGAGVDGLRAKRDPMSIGPEDFFDESNRVRELFGRLVHASSSSVAIIPSVSYGLASIAQNLPFGRGDEILVLEEQFPSNVYVWRRAADAVGASIVTVGPGPGVSGRAARWNERILDAIGQRTAVIALPHVHWADGTRFDLEAISRRARDVDAALIVDGTQSVGALPFDIERIQPDAVICAGYKWLLGPYSIGMAYFAERHHGGRPLEENWIGRLHSEKFSGLVQYEDQYQDGAVRYDVGERSNFILMPMMAAALNLVLEWTPEAIQAYCRQLTQPLIDRAVDLGIHVEDTDGRGEHLFGVRTVDGADPGLLREALTSRRVSVSVRGSAIRIAPHVYNDEQDVEALIDAIASVNARVT